MRLRLRRWAGGVLVGVLAASVAVTAVPSAAASRVPHGRFGVGDSIMLSASDELAADGFRTNAEVGRQFIAGVDIVRRLATRDRLPRHAVVHLGTNGPVDVDDCARLIGDAPRRQIYLVNVRVPRVWEGAVNETLRACARPYARVHYLNWYRKSGRRLDDWIAPDGYHLTADGQAAYAAWIDARVDAVVESQRTSR